MTIIPHQKVDRVVVVGSWSSRITGLIRVLAGILFFAPVLVLGVILPSSYNVTLAWDPSSSANVAGYRVYYGPSSGNYTNSVIVGNVTTNMVSGLVASVTYFFAVTAISLDGQESLLSNEISFVPGVPQVRIRSTPAGQFGLTVSGLIGHRYEIEATQDFLTWTIIGTVAMGAGGEVDFTDMNAASFPQRYYRTQDAL